jgi:hypothetical protein
MRGLEMFGQGRENGCRPQDVSHGSEFNDQDPRLDRMIVAAIRALDLFLLMERTGSVSEKMATIDCDRYSPEPLFDGTHRRISIKVTLRFQEGRTSS